MLHHFFQPAVAFAKLATHQSSAQLALARDTVKRILTTAHYTLTILGVSAIALLGTLLINPDLFVQLRSKLPFLSQELTATTANSPVVATDFLGNQPTESTEQFQHTTSEFRLASNKPFQVSSIEQTERKLTASTKKQQQLVAEWVSKRYRVAGDAATMLVSTVYSTANEIKIDPLLVLAVMAIESRFNPFAESPMGAQGLMQVMSKVHHEKFQELGGVKAALNPAANIKVGSLLLKEYVHRSGSIEGGLKIYVGASSSETESGYGARVIAEYNRLKEVATGKKIPTITTAANSPPQKQRLTPDSKPNGSTIAEDNAGLIRQATKEEQVAVL